MSCQCRDASVAVDYRYQPGSVLVIQAQLKSDPARRELGLLDLEVLVVWCFISLISSSLHRYLPAG